ncbi:hypothetical protein V8B97DRAFT_1917978 [Scleroderma yunnanense]
MTKPELYPNSKSVVDWMLVYYHFNLASSDKRSWVNRPTTKADTLVGVGKTPRSGWKEWLVDWMEFEELVLMGVDPSLVLTIRIPGRPGRLEAFQEVMIRLNGDFQRFRVIHTNTKSDYTLLPFSATEAIKYQGGSTSQRTEDLSSQELDEVFLSFSPSPSGTQVDPSVTPPLEGSLESESKGSPHRCTSSCASTGAVSNDANPVMQELLLAREVVP